jgi:hypothetical protein
MVLHVGQAGSQRGIEAVSRVRLPISSRASDTRRGSSAVASPTSTRRSAPSASGGSLSTPL